MNKLYNFFYAGLLLLLSVSVSAQTVTFSAANQTANQGQQICVPVSVTDFTNILGFQFSMNYNPNILQFNSIQNINLSSLDQNSFGTPGPNSSVPAGSITVGWFSGNLQGVTVPNGTVIFEVCFTVTGSTNTQFSFSGMPTSIEVTDGNENTINFNGQNASITVNGGGGGGGNPGDFILTIQDVNGQQGSQVCQTVSVQGFTDILGMQFSINYDPSILQFVSLGNFNLPGLDQNLFGFPPSTNPGTITLSWFDNSLSGVTLPDGSVIFNICFNVIGNTTTTVSFSNTPTAIEITNADEQNVPFNGENGTVTLGGGGGGGFTGFGLIIQDVNAQQGSQVCLNVSTQEFTDILGMQFSINYDPSILQFVSVGSFNLPGLDQNLFGLPPNTPPGTITLSWFDNSLNGVTLPDGSVIFNICFNVIGNTTTTVSFSNTPTAIEITDADEQNVPFNSDSGVVTIGGGGGGGQITLDLNTATGDVGDQVCLNVSVQNFTGIKTLQFSINYNPAHLQFVSVGNFNLPGLTQGQFSLPPGGTSPGQLALSWSTAEQAGVTLPNGTTIFQVCFQITGGAGSTTPVQFSNTPTPMQATNASGQNVTVNKDDGAVIVNVPLEGFFLIIEDKVVCPDDDDEFCVLVTVNDFTDILGMQFSINYNPAQLQFLSIGNFNLPGLDQNLFGLPPSTPAGTITLSWFDNSLSGVSLDDGAPIFQLCFRALGAEGSSSDIVFSGTPTAIEITNIDEQTVPFQSLSGTITVTCSAGDPLVLEAMVTNVACRNQATGAINLTVTGGVPPNYTYQWSNGATTQDISNLPAGTYSVTVTSTDGQTANGTYMVTQPATAVGVNVVTVNHVSCNGASDGSIVVAGNGGSQPYTYSWSPTSVPPVANPSNLAAFNFYRVTVTDAAGCPAVSPFIDIDEPAAIVINLNPVNINLGNDGAVNLSVSGGSGSGYTFSWSGPGNFTSTQQNISGLNNAGEYCVTVTDGTGCTKTGCVQVAERVEICNFSIIQSCDTGANGGVDITICGGTPPFTYAWTVAGGGPVISINQDLAGVAAGNYSVTVNDASGDQVVGTFEVTSTPGLTVTSTITPAGTSGNNGQISLDISGGQPGYTVNWSNGASGNPLTNLAPGEYCVTVTDQGGCTFSDCYTISSQPITLASATATNISCFGEVDGVALIQVVGGGAPFTLQFGGETYMNSTGNFEITGLSAGNYSFTVTDGTGETVNGSVTVSEPSILEVAANDINLIHDSEDTPGCTGSISLDIQGGTPPFSVSWDSGQSGAQLTALCEGNYVPTIVDSNGCTLILEEGIEVTLFKVEVLEVTGVQCLNDANGAVDLDITGGAQPYVIEWRNSNNEVVSTVADPDDLLAGDYTVVVTEPSGNSITRSVTITTQSDLSIEVEILSDFNGYDVSCPDSEDGEVRIIGVNGIGAYTYEWERGGVLVGTQATLNNAPAGLYEATVIDESGCEITEEVFLDAPPALDIIGNTQTVSCPGDKDGAIQVVIAGNPQDVFLFNWSNGSIGPNPTQLAAGSYTVTVTDINGCNSQATFEVQNPEPLEVSILSEPATDGCNGTVRVVATGGSAPYLYEWINVNAGLEVSLVTDLCPGDYFVKVRDSKGCISNPETTVGRVDDRRFPCFEERVVITPDGNGANDEFIIFCIGEFPDNFLQIYNRWGQLVYETENYDNSWSGKTKNGQDLPEGPYYYVIEFRDPDNNLVQRKGSITILRE
jgi:gliding motility-associated-like protein